MDHTHDITNPTGLANIDRLTDTLWTGGDLPSDRLTATYHVYQWLDLCIRRVIDCRIEWTDAELIAKYAPEIEYLHAGIDDAGQRLPDEWFDRITDFANRDDDGLLIHCHMGINRGPSGAYATLLSRGADPIEAIDLIRTQRPIAAIAYAEDALGWWHRRTFADSDKQADDIARLEQWRADNGHDTARIIRRRRAAGN